MYFVRKHAMVMFVAQARLQTVKAEVTLKGASDIEIHNLWAGIQQSLINTVFSLPTEDVEKTGAYIETDAHSFVSNCEVKIIPRVKRPENASCILCSLEEHFKTDKVDLEFFEEKNDLANEYGLTYSASVFWIGAGRIRPSVLYTDKGELDRKTILIGRESDINVVSNNHPVIAHRFPDGNNANVQNDQLCRNMFVLDSGIGETGYAFD